jgi:hypothetical protein
MAQEKNPAMVKYGRVSRKKSDVKTYLYLRRLTSAIRCRLTASRSLRRFNSLGFS